ncbi:hypothetical protein CW368_12575 [Actinomycetales bacterium SN12]|nr:hypothetical protein CW368_12575 [Actinomycetales bacterium SN12]
MHLSSDDLLPALGWIAAWLGVAGIVVAISIWRARRQGSTTLALDVTRNASLVYIGLMVIGAGLSGLDIMGGEGVALDDDAWAYVRENQSALHSSACPETYGGEVGMLCGDSYVGPVPFGIQLLIFAGTLLALAASGAIAWAIHNATRRAGQRQPFHPSVSRTFGVVAIVSMSAVVIGDLLHQIGMTLAVRSLDWNSAAPPLNFGLDVELWPFAVAVGLFALSAIFRFGAQLQNEREQLRRETEGLI